MKYEEWKTLEYKRINDENNFTPVDPFAEYLSGVTDDELYVLLTGLEMVQDMDDMWLADIDRTEELVNIAVLEFFDRGMDNGVYVSKLNARGAERLNGGVR